MMKIQWHGSRGQAFKKEAGILTIQIVAEVGRELGRTLKLMPGVNEVPEEDWEAALKIVVVRHHLDARNLEVVTNPDPAAVELAKSAAVVTNKYSDIKNNLGGDGGKAQPAKK